MKSDFLQIIDQHQNMIHKVCRMYRDSREDQEDLFQEIVLQLWKAWPTFRKEAKVSTWLYSIALNTALAAFRKKSISLDSESKIPADLPQSSDKQTSENEERLFLAIRKLNQAERAIIALYLEDFSYREIGEITGISENYVAVRMNRIKEKLKKLLT
ncbi:MAG: sigma-70 family RNA polymerase sigma factor [Bacteroidetes bacterium]|nr:sigma-70 family RNA polymerase sigma factor [Bacteroidota bacterium]MCB0843997.1 sigma-70 family RNA polymerase sigma factor [Bacteroidota bacterium]